MMNWGYGSMMGSGWEVVGLLFWIILFIDAILLGIWLWQQIQGKNGRR